MSDHRNVVLVTVDSLRADHCGFLGSELGITPALDELADEGLVFEQAIAPGPSTYESMPAVFTGELMTGRDASSTRLEDIRFNMNRMTIPEWFEREGYATAAFTANPYTGRHTSFARGFDHYRDFLGNRNGWLPQRVREAPIVAELDNIAAMVRRDRASKPWQSFYDELVRWIDSADRPFFVWVFLMEPHTPYLVEGDRLSAPGRAGMYYHNWKLWLTKKWGVPPEAIGLDGEALRRLYRLAIESTDEFFGRLLTDIGHSEPTVVLHADHGEAFGEHGLYGHREHLYEEHVHVPLLVYNSSVTGRVPTPTSLTELPALASGAARDSLRVPDQSYALSRGLHPPSFAVRGPTWKYLTILDADGRTEELYDLATDPDERSNQLAEHPELTEACRELLRRRTAHDAEVRSVRTAAAEIPSEPVVLD